MRRRKEQSNREIWRAGRDQEITVTVTGDNTESPSLRKTNGFSGEESTCVYIPATFCIPNKYINESPVKEYAYGKESR